MSDAATKTYYEREAQYYDRTHGAGQFGAQYSIHHHYLPFWKRYLRKQDRILEIGCGTGVFTQVFGQLCRSVTAVDLSPKMIAQARKRNPHVEFKVASAERLPFRDKRFDAVVCVNAFVYVTDQDHALMEIRRVLKPAGKLLIIDPNILCPAYWMMYVTRHRRLRLFFRRFLRGNRWWLRQLLTHNGWNVVECREGNFVPHGVGRLRAWGFFIPLDRTLGRLPFLPAMAMRVYCAAVASPEERKRI